MDFEGEIHETGPTDGILLFSLWLRILWQKGPQNQVQQLRLLNRFELLRKINQELGMDLWKDDRQAAKFPRTSY